MCFGSVTAQDGMQGGQLVADSQSLCYRLPVVLSEVLGHVVQMFGA